MPLTVSDELLQTAHLSEAEFLQEISVTRFQQDRLTLGQAAAFAGLRQLDMQRILAARRIPLHYGPEDLEHDLATVCKPILDQMIVQAGFWIGNDLRSRFLVRVGERP